MTPWRAEQLWQLYLMVYNELTRELETERIENIPAGPPERILFLQGFPTRYLRTHTTHVFIYYRYALGIAMIAISSSISMSF